MDRNYVLVNHEKPVLSDNYIVEFVHDATENYMREENMIVGVLMLLKHLSLC